MQKEMNNADILIWVYLSFCFLGATAFIAYHIRKSIIKRRETDSERDIRERNELERYKKLQERAKREGVGTPFIFLYL